MQQFLEFIVNHWALWLAFFVVLSVLIGFELQAQLRGVPPLSVQEVTRLINHEEGVIVDIRNENSFAKGHILGAINILFSELERQLARVETHKTKPVIVVTDASAQQQAIQAASLLRKNGFTHVSILRGGIAAWQSASLPLVK